MSKEAYDSHSLAHLTCLDFSLCLKITEKVAINIASEASCVYILRLKMPKMVQFDEFL